jgi:hypothetical protein
MMSAASIQAKYGGHVGSRFGKLTLERIADRRGDRNRLLGEFRCDCGGVVEKALTRVIAGSAVLHCGCETDRGKNRTHGQRNSGAYVSWLSMKRRCLDTSDKDYQRYGAKGIGVCPQWACSFAAFYAHVGDRPKGTTLDRIDGSRGYEPGNVRWATPAEQARNRRDLTTVRTPLGVMSLVDYAAHIGISKGAAHLRLKRGQLKEVERV